MAQETENEGRLRKLVLPGALAAASAGIALLATAKPERLRQAIEKLSGQARDVAGDLKQRDLMGDLKERAESVTSQIGAEPAQSDGTDFEARRREREQRRSERRKRART